MSRTALSLSKAPADAPSKAPPDAGEHLVIIGNGMAGHRLLQALQDRPTRPTRITMIGAEASPAYNRILLSPWLAGEIERDSLDTRLSDEMSASVEWRLGERVVTIDRTHRRVHTDIGGPVHYDRLVIATGSRPTLPAIPGIELGNVGGFRNLDDVDWLIARSSGSRAVVVGGGLLGLEAAEGLRKRGLAVTLLQRGDRLMNRQLDVTAATWLRDTLERRGLTIETHASLSGCDADAQGNVHAVRLTDGRRLAADCVVVAAGITPNAELGRLARLDVGAGICVDATLTTRDPRIHAIGECCEFDGTTVGLVEPIWQQVETLADLLGGQTPAPYIGSACATRLKVAGISLYAFGPVEAEPDDDTLTYADPEGGDYRRLLLRNDRLIGAVLYGDTGDGPALFQLSRAGANLGHHRDLLLFGASDVAQRLTEDTQHSLEEAA
jgi:nitrite reductase (NADH) large subunit